MVYDANGNELLSVYDANGIALSQAYDANGNPLIDSDPPVVVDDIVYESAHSNRNLYAGGLIEVQPDSWDGSTVCTGDIVQPTDPTAWGFPMSLSANSKRLIKNEVFGGNGYGISFIRFPMGFGYRGYRNVDQTTGLAKNIGQRWEGQNSALNAWFASIAQSGGGLDVEYWCPAPYWLTGGAYYNADVSNELWAGGSYPRTTTLSSIKSSDPTQYNAQIEAFTDAIVNDLEYVHQNVAPVRMYTLAAEPTGSGQLKYGHCHWDSTVYNDVFAILHPKVMASQTLATYNGKANVVLMHLCADHTSFTIGSSTINNHSSWIWGYSHDVMHGVSGANGIGADQIKSLTFPTGSQASWENVFMCEYEYFGSSKTNEFRCANNIVRMICELAYRKARITMPIIHICKPTGQSSAQTNTAGYCVYAVDMATGNYTVNPWAYNSWKMINDNLPVGAELYQGGDGGINFAGYVIFKKDGKTYLLLGNYASVSSRFTFEFDGTFEFTGKQYDLTHVGSSLPTKSGASITFEVPSYTGCIYECDNNVAVTSVSAENDLTWERGYIDDNGNLTDQGGSYVSKQYTQASNSITISTSVSVQNIRLAEYDASYNFIQREYASGTSATFTLNASTAYVRIGFKFVNSQTEETVNALFDGGYVIS